MKNASLTGIGLAAGSFTLPFQSIAKDITTVQNYNSDKQVWGACSVNCGSRCPVKLHIKNDEVYWVESDHSGNDTYGQYQVRACLRGRSIRQRINHPDRLKYPMKRVGKRGDGDFVRISWDEALDSIADSIKKTIKKYSNEAIYINYASGVIGGNITFSEPGESLFARLMNCYGGYLNQHSNYSNGQLSSAMEFTYGTQNETILGNSISDVVNTKLLVMFGNNPAETRMCGGGIIHYLTQAREKSKTRMIVIDPRYTDTASGREDEWIPIRPGTDAALAAGLAYVLISENMVDQHFLDEYCVGYDEKTLPASAPSNGHYKAYILGNGNDKTAKTPEWASSITGIPASRIVKLAREIGQAKPAFICQGWGPQRQANGELNVRAIAMLSILTGNVGISGGNSGGREGTFVAPIERIPVFENPVKTSIPCFKWTDAVERGTEMTALRDGIIGKDKLDTSIKFIWNRAGNMLINQHSNINRTHDILVDENNCETIIVSELFMTSSAKYADILIPELMTLEQNDFMPNGAVGNMGYLIHTQPVTEPKFERKTIYWIVSEIAKRLGDDVYQQFTEGRTQEEWLEFLYGEMKKKHDYLPSYNDFRQMGIFKINNPDGEVVAFESFRNDPEKNPLNTPSGKIEIYSERIAKIASEWELEEDEVISPIPVYTPTFDGWDSKEREKYSLQMTGFHFKQRAHSSYGNIDLLKSSCPQEIWINPVDAVKRNITNGDKVKVYNSRGTVIIQAKVTPRVMPGVTAMGEGAWHNADMSKDKIDHGGCINTLTSHRASPLSKSNPQHTNLVEIEKLEDITNV